MTKTLLALVCAGLVGAPALVSPSTVVPVFAAPALAYEQPPAIPRPRGGVIIIIRGQEAAPRSLLAYEQPPAIPRPRGGAIIIIRGSDGRPAQAGGNLRAGLGVANPSAVSPA